MKYPFLHDYILSEAYIARLNPKETGKMRHNFYALPEGEIQEALKEFYPFPAELQQFYQEIGFGLFHINRGGIHRILDPHSLIFINHQKGEYRRDRILAESIMEPRLIFFDSQQYGYYSIEKDNTEGKNAVYYKGEKVDNSLYRFIYRIHDDKNYLKYVRGEAEAMLRKKKLSNKNVGFRQAGNTPPDPKPDTNALPQGITGDRTRGNSAYKSPWLFHDDDDNIIIS
jgi:hypothetical protein